MPGAWPEEIFLVRHGESEGNVARAKAIAAHAEILDVDENDKAVPMSPRGAEQAAALGKWFANAPPSVVWTSPYRRARETARIAADAWPAPAQVVLDDRLRERSLGRLNRLTNEGIRARYPQEALARMRLGKFDYRPPLGESWADVAHRLRGVVDALHACSYQRVMIVTHQVVVMCMRYLLERLTVAQLMAIDAKVSVANCAVTHYRSTESGLQLVAFNDVTPLAALSVPVTKTDDAADVR